MIHDDGRPCPSNRAFVLETGAPAGVPVAAFTGLVSEGKALSGCGDCDGRLVVTDLWGSLTGTPGAVVPCECQAQVWGNEVCACSVPVWPGGNGFSGWVPTGGLIGVEPVYGRCQTHGATMPAAIVAGAVAA